MKTHFSSARTLLAPLALLLACNATAPAQAQRAPRMQRVPIEQLNVQTAKIALMSPKISAPLRSYLVAQKPILDEEILQKSFVLRDGVTLFKLADGTERPLMPAMEVTEVASPAIPQELLAAKSYINATAKLSDVRRTSLTFDLSLILTLLTDHRADMSPIRDQGGRGTCTAFAFMGAFESFPSVKTDMSEQYLFHEGQRKAGQPYSTTKGLLPKWAAEVGSEGLVTEDKMPYTASYPPANETIPAAAVSAPKYKVTDWEFIPNAGLSGVSIRNTNYLELLIKQGYNIPFWTQVAWSNSQTTGIIDVVMTGTGANKTPAASRGDHEMVIVGYNAPEKYFIVRNSWGTGFGHAGYAYISYDYIRTYAVEGLYIKSVSAPPVIFDPGPIGTFKGRIRRFPIQ